MHDKSVTIQNNKNRKYKILHRMHRYLLFWRKRKLKYVENNDIQDHNLSNWLKKEIKDIKDNTQI